MIYLIGSSGRLQISVQEGVERRGAPLEDRTGESLFQMIHMVVLLEYYCHEKISVNFFIGLYIQKVLITEST